MESRRKSAGTGIGKSHGRLRRALVATSTVVALAASGLAVAAAPAAAQACRVTVGKDVGVDRGVALNNGGGCHSVRVRHQYRTGSNSGGWTAWSNWEPTWAYSRVQSIFVQAQGEGR